MCKPLGENITHAYMARRSAQRVTSSSTDSKLISTDPSPIVHPGTAQTSASVSTLLKQSILAHSDICHWFVGL